MRRKRVTSSDVAKQAGVSQSAVSRAFTPSAKIADDTKERILAIAKQMGYQPSGTGGNWLSTNREAIAILCSGYSREDVVRLERVTTFLAKHSYAFEWVGLSEGKLKRNQLYEAYILLQTPNKALSQQLEQLSRPTIAIQASYQQANLQLAFDDFADGLMLGEQLVRCGITTFAFVGGHHKSLAHQQRKQGFLQAVEQRGLQVLCSLEKEDSYAWGQEAAAMILTQQHPEVVFCSSDTIALGLMDALRYRRQLMIPRDIQVIGFGNSETSAFEAYQLSTVAQPWDKLLLKLKNYLDEVLALKSAPHQDTSDISLQGALISRQSLRNISS